MKITRSMKFLSSFENNADAFIELNKNRKKGRVYPNEIKRIIHASSTMP